MSKEFERQSKFLSLVLRHKPDQIGVVLDQEGWAELSELVQKACASGMVLTEERVKEIVVSSDKKRFALSSDGRRIRANQGHSIDVSLNLPERTPPEILFHGTATRFLDSILVEGLKPGSRQHVHLSAEMDTAVTVGSRYGKPVVLTVLSGKMNHGGHRFYLSENGVWLTDHVPPEFIEAAAV